MSSMLIKWLRLTQELKENPGCYNNRGFYFPPQSRMLTKSWDEENAPAAMMMMMRELSGRHLFKFIRFQMIADIKCWASMTLPCGEAVSTALCW